MDDPSLLNAESVPDLQELILNYPYFQTARILNLINLKILKDYRFEQELRRVAAFAADRARLREWIVMLENEPEKNTHLKALEEQIKASLREIEIRKSRLRELIEEKNAITGDKDQHEQELTDAAIDRPLRPLPKDQMLEDFLDQKEVPAQGHVTFYNPEDSARRSVEDNEDILSETLARLVAAQGKKDRAIKIYQKLMLKYPQKSSYFASQIEKLRKES
jgi:regulator of replication initiation timing